MKEFELLEKIVNTESVDHEWKLKMDLKIDKIPENKKWKQQATREYTLKIVKAKSVVVLVKRILSHEEFEAVKNVHRTDNQIKDELARQAIIQLAGKGIKQIT